MKSEVAIMFDFIVDRGEYITISSMKAE